METKIGCANKVGSRNHSLLRLNSVAPTSCSLSVVVELLASSFLYHISTNFHQNWFIIFCVILLTDRQTDRQTDADDCINSFDGANYLPVSAMSSSASTAA